MKKKKTLEELLEEALVPEEEQPYEVPENWVWVNVGDVIELISGRDLSVQNSAILMEKVFLISLVLVRFKKCYIIERWIEKPTVIGKEGEIF